MCRQTLRKPSEGPVRKIPKQPEAALASSLPLIPGFLLESIFPKERLLFFSNENSPVIKHYHIYETSDVPKRYYLAEGHMFNSIPKLINYHQHNAGGEWRRPGQAVFWTLSGSGEGFQEHLPLKNPHEVGMPFFPSSPGCLAGNHRSHGTLW